MRPWIQSILTRDSLPPPSARMAFTPPWISSTRCLSHCPTTLPFLATGPSTSSTRSTTSLSLVAASLVPHFTLPLLSSLWPALSQPLSLPSLVPPPAATATSPEGRVSSVMGQRLASPRRMSSASSRAPLRVCGPSTLSLVPVRKLEHRSHFSSFSSLWTLPLFLSLATFPLYVPPNRLHSPPSLVFIAASSLT